MGDDSRYPGSVSMERNGEWARGVDRRKVEKWEARGWRVVTRREEEAMCADSSREPAPEPFDFEALELDTLKLLYGRAMSEGVDLPDPHGNAKEPWYRKTLRDSGWEPKTDG